MRYLLTSLLCLYTLGITAQVDCDIILTKDGDSIEAKIIEVGLSETKYKMCDYIDGPIRIIKNKQIYHITYANGQKEVINSPREKIHIEFLQSNFKYEITAGLNMSKVAHVEYDWFPMGIESKEYFGNRLSYNFGVTATKQLTKRLQYNTGLHYSSKGYSEIWVTKDVEIWGEMVEIPESYFLKHFKLNYITNSQILNININRQISFFYGCEVSYLLLRKMVVLGFNEEDNLISEGVDYGSLRLFDIGVISGVSFQENRFKYSINYTHGIVPIYDFNPSSYPINDDEEGFLNRVLSFNTSYLLSKK